MATISAALAIAVEHHQAGRLELAAEIYRRILAVDPDQPDALHLLGLIAHQEAKHETAVEYIEQAIRRHATNSVFYNNLGEAYRALGRVPEAIACYRRALEIDAQHVAAHNNLGIAFQEQGRLDEAIACYRRALEADPQHVEAYNNLGIALQDQGELDAAVACFRRAVELKPDYAEAYNNLGVVLKEQGKLDEAFDCYRRAISLKADFAEAHNNLAIVLTDWGRLHEAIACYRQALQLMPDYAEAHSNLGNTLTERGEWEEAFACYRRALQIEPTYVEAHNNLGIALKDQGRLGEAVECHRQALALKPDCAEAYNSLGNALREQGEWNEAVACYRRALQLKPESLEAHSNLLRALHYRDGVTLAELSEAHREYERRHAAPLRSVWQAHDNVRDPNRALRLGFLSPDFGRHPVGYFLRPVLENLDREQAAAICYHDRIRSDDMTANVQAAASTWRPVYALTDEQLAEQVRADQIDILFDLAGHTARNRLLVFARKPAPVQITWMGDAGTTGLAAIDYILGDWYEIPPDAELFYRERVLRLPDGYVCYAPPDDAPPVGPLPALATGCVTFASFSNPAKITPRVVALWADILARVPQSRLVLKYRGMDDAHTQRRYLDLFAEKGIAAQRLELLGESPHAEFLASYGHVDIALDTFPYSGGLTTCEALWMGVPVITCPGETFASRHSLTHLSNVGLAEQFVARDLARYVDLAVRWASDLDRLAEVRASLRGRMAASPLCDGKRFAANLSALLRDVWRTWASGA